MIKVTTKSITNSINQEVQTQQSRRQFIEKFGKLAAITPVALTALMSPQTSAAPRSGCNKNDKGCK